MSLRDADWRYPALLPLSWLYHGAVQIRNFAHDREWVRRTRVASRVVSLGNLLVGGTGKTPTTAFLAQTLSQARVRVAIVARGYGREGQGTCIVSDGQGNFAGLRQAGDEPLLLAHACPGVPVVVDRDKTRAAQIAVQNFHPDILLVDDGFQHRKLSRDCDLVLVPATMFLRRPWLLPAGPLREPAANLARGTLALLSGLAVLAPAEQEVARQGCRELMQGRFIPVEFQAQRLEHLWTGESFSLDRLAGAALVLVSGIARPERFRLMAQVLGANLRDELAFQDHHTYRPADASQITRRFQNSGADFVLTTSKDGMKLRGLPALQALPLLVLHIAPVFAPQNLEVLLGAVLEAAPAISSQS